MQYLYLTVDSVEKGQKNDEWQKLNIFLKLRPVVGKFKLMENTITIAVKWCQIYKNL